MIKQQKHTLLSTIIIGVGLFTLPAQAEVLSCNGRLAVVTGSISSVNISATQQHGVITTVITPVNGGAPIFSDSQGMVGGEITRQRGIKSLMSHEMLFSSGEELTTKNDLAITLLPPIGFEADGSACAFNVFETINNISGTGVFEGVKGAIYAEGTVSYCSYNNQNNFNLSGLVCIRD